MKVSIIHDLLIYAKLLFFGKNIFLYKNTERL